MVWSDGSPADFSVWLEGSDPPPLSWACIAVFASAIFQVTIRRAGLSSENFREKKTNREDWLAGLVHLALTPFVDDTSLLIV